MTTKTATTKTTKTATTKPLKLTKNEWSILWLLSDGPTTLSEMAAHLRRWVDVPSRWSYSTKVDKDARKAWLASLLARNGIRKPVRLGLIRKLKPGTYAITAAGRRALFNTEGK